MRKTERQRSQTERPRESTRVPLTLNLLVKSKLKKLAEGSKLVCKKKHINLRHSKGEVGA